LIFLWIYSRLWWGVDQINRSSNKSQTFYPSLPFSKVHLEFPPAGGGFNPFLSEKVAARPSKIRLNPHNPHNPGPHPATRGVAEQIKKGLVIYKTTPVMG
jgi:hypothetical protein